MNNIVELGLISTASTVTRGFLDLFGTEPINIKMSISDIKDISKRSAPYTQSFTLPGTKNNNEMLSHIFNIGSDSSYDSRKKTPAYLAVDSTPVMSNGIFQLTGIVVDENKKIDYQATIFSESQDLFAVIGDAYIEDLDYSDLDHTYSYSAITNSWTGASNSYFYPLIDYGYDLNITDMNIGAGVTLKQIYPATQVKTIVDKIFDAAGYTYNSAFLTNSYFENLYIPYNSIGGLTQNSGFTTQRQFMASMSTSTATTINVVGSNVYGFANQYTNPFNDDSTIPNFDNGGLFNVATYKYSADTFTSQEFFINLDFEFASTNPAVTVNGGRPVVVFYRSTFNSGTIGIPVNNMWPGVSTNQRTQFLVSVPVMNDPLSTWYYPAQPGETFWVKTYFLFQYQAPASGGTVTYTLYSDNTRFYNKVNADVFPGQTLDYQNLVPKKIKQRDFLNSLISMHNLYLDPSKDNAKEILIEPRDVYLAGATKDWTNKLDLKTAINQKLISEQQNKKLIFTYKEDKDFYNTDYKSATNRIFGDEYFIVDNDFITGEKKIELIFSPTPSVPVQDSSLSTSDYANEFVIPTIGKLDSSNTFGRTDFNIRILQRNSAKLLPLETADYWKLDGKVQTKFPYLGMKNHPGAPTIDIAFESVELEYYNLSSTTKNTLINHYWREYLEQISDKDSRLITCNIYLTPRDIQEFKFSDSIFIDGLTEDGGHYFIVNSIDYSPTSIASSKVELIKVKNKYVDKTSNKPIINNWNTGVPVQAVAQGQRRRH